MRIGERASSQVRAEAQGGGFGDALRRARGEGGRRAGPGAVPPERRRLASTDPARDAPGDGGPPAGSAPSGGGEAARSARDDGASTPELAALARTLPVAVAAAGARQGAPLCLSFGRSLRVELRAGTAGIELLLRPEPRLARIVEAELPGLLAALRVRGVAVARAEVRPRGGAAPSAR